jgi:hypothetical protein
LGRIHYLQFLSRQSLGLSLTAPLGLIHCRQRQRRELFSAWGIAPGMQTHFQHPTKPSPKP